MTDGSEGRAYLKCDNTQPTAHFDRGFDHPGRQHRDREADGGPGGELRAR